MESVQAIKQRFEIIGNDVQLNRALEKATQVAPTDISVLVTGESGVGKEAIPKIIHALSHRKHAKYIAVNCGAISACIILGIASFPTPLSPVTKTEISVGAT